MFVSNRIALLGTLASLTATGLFAACSGDDTTVAPVDAGTDGKKNQPDTSSVPDTSTNPDTGVDAGAQGLNKLGHFVVIYLENHSFDNLYGEFAGAEGLNGLDAGAPNVAQLDQNDVAYSTLPQNQAGIPTTLANAPFPIEDYVPADKATRDLHHIFYTEQFQINDGGMNRYALWSDALGLTMGYYHTAGLPLAALAKNFVLADHFFHSAFGGSFLNHQWLIAAQTPQYPGTVPTDAGMIVDPTAIKYGAGEAPVTQDGYLVNTCFSVNSPHPTFPIPPVKLIANLTNDTIGDRLTASSIDWAWYSEGWNDAIQYSADGGIGDGGGPSVANFQYHHQPFIYYAKYADGQPGRAHLKDEADFLASAKAGTLPPVSFYKPAGVDNEHPGYTNLLRGEKHVMDVITALQASPNYADMAIIITYDEHGGFWDHVSPPKGDQWGPGSRVPAIIISPYAKKGLVDHTPYETVSILTTIELRFGLQPLSTRDKNAAPLTNAFSF